MSIVLVSRQRVEAPEGYEDWSDWDQKSWWSWMSTLTDCEADLRRREREAPERRLGLFVRANYYDSEDYVVRHSRGESKH